MSVRPNVVVMVSDTFRRDHLGAYWNQSIRTRGTGHIPELYELTEDLREKENMWELRAEPLGLQENRVVPGMAWASSW